MNAAGRGQRGDRRHCDRHLPSDAAGCVEQMRRRRSQRQRADENSDHQAHVSFRPRGRELHADRIDTGHADSGDRAQRQRTRGRGIDGQQARVGDRTHGCRDAEQPTRVDTVRQSKQRTGNAPDDKAQLHRARQRGLHEWRQPKLRRERRQDRGRGEPKRHRGDLAQGDDRNRDRLRSPAGYHHASSDHRSRRADPRPAAPGEWSLFPVPVAKRASWPSISSAG